MFLLLNQNAFEEEFRGLFESFEHLHKKVLNQLDQKKISLEPCLNNITTFQDLKIKSSHNNEI